MLRRSGASSRAHGGQVTGRVYDTSPGVVLGMRQLLAKQALALGSAKPGPEGCSPKGAKGLKDLPAANISRRQR